MKELTTIIFEDEISSDRATVIVRHDATHLALALSLESDGDIEVFMNKADVPRLVQALQKAIE